MTNAAVGWGLAVIALAMAWVQYGWPGVALAASVVVFWLLLQFTRAMRAMKQASQRSVGSVESGVMLNARLRQGMTMMQLIALTRSLGQRVSGQGDDDATEAWRWTDAGDVGVTLRFRAGKLVSWTLERPDQTTALASANAGVDAEATALAARSR